MTADEAISTLTAAGLHIRQFKESPLELFMLGDPQDHVPDNDRIVEYQWACSLKESEACWQVTPPPLLVPSPGPTSETRSLAEAVGLVIDLYLARHKLDGDSPKIRYDNAIAMMLQWCIEKGYNGNAR